MLLAHVLPLSVSLLLSFFKQLVLHLVFSGGQVAHFFLDLLIIRQSLLSNSLYSFRLVFYPFFWGCFLLHYFENLFFFQLADPFLGLLLPLLDSFPQPFPLFCVFSGVKQPPLQLLSSLYLHLLLNSLPLLEYFLSLALNLFNKLALVLDKLKFSCLLNLQVPIISFPCLF